MMNSLKPRISSGLKSYGLYLVFLNIVRKAFIVFNIYILEWIGRYGCRKSVIFIQLGKSAVQYKQYLLFESAVAQPLQYLVTLLLQSVI